MNRAIIFVLFICAYVHAKEIIGEQRQQGWLIGNLVSLLGHKGGLLQNNNLCDDVFQAPINLPLDAAIANYGQLNFTAFQYTYDGSVSLGSNHIIVRLTPSNGILLSGAGLPGTFYLHEMRIYTPSAHTLSGVSYPAGVQYVFINTLYSDYAEASTHEDGIAIVISFIVVGTNDNPAIEGILNAADLLSDEVTIQELDNPLSPSSLLPKEKCSFFRYRGKLSRRDCTEIVTYTIFTDTIKISEQQLADLKAILNNSYKLKSIMTTSSTFSHGLDLSIIKPKRRRVVTIQPIMFCKQPFLQKDRLPWYIFHKLQQI